MSGLNPRLDIDSDGPVTEVGVSIDVPMTDGSRRTVRSRTGEAFESATGEQIGESERI